MSLTIYALTITFLLINSFSTQQFSLEYCKRAIAFYSVSLLLQRLSNFKYLLLHNNTLSILGPPTKFLRQC